MSWRARRLFGMATLGGVLAGCASTSSMLVQRFSREHSCQADKVLIRQSGATTYFAEGCGHRAEYVCNSVVGSPGSEHGCAKQGIVPNASTEAPKRTHYQLPDPPK